SSHSPTDFALSGRPAEGLSFAEYPELLRLSARPNLRLQFPVRLSRLRFWQSERRWAFATALRQCPRRVGRSKSSSPSSTETFAEARQNRFRGHSSQLHR